MTHVTHLHEVSEQPPTFVAVGVFDGVHRGHQLILQQMIAGARAAGARAAVLTFFPHPKVLLQGLSGRIYLTTLEERVRLLADLGIDLIVTHPFDEETRTTRAADFVDQLRHHMGMCQLWSGDFGLGYRREGTAEVLREMGKHKGFEIREVQTLLEIGGERVSSTRIRRGLATGDVQDVGACLGRPYALTGTVVAGDRRGRMIGFPTANLDVWEQIIIPGNGVYATYAYRHGQRYPAAANIGVRPTVDGLNLRVEAHLLDFEGDLYGEELRIEFVDRVRAEMKFKGLDELRAQIAADVQQVRGTLKLRDA